MNDFQKILQARLVDLTVLAQDIGISGLIDITCMSLIIYALLVWFKKTKVAFILTGILICSFVYLLSYQFDLFLMTSVFRAFFTVIIVAMIVMFQEELRHLFEQVAIFSLNPKLKRKLEVVPDLRDETEILVRTLSDLARERIGALVVIRGSDLILRHLDGGVNLNGDLSEALLKSIFDPNSIGHDGAMVLEKDRVLKFACHLPLSKDFKKLKNRGTRHAAALGISELCDALCIVVSEERGTVSLVRNGEMREMRDAADLTRQLERFYDDILPKKRKRSWKEFFQKNYAEKIIAILATLVLWFVLVHESALISRTYRVPVEYTPPPGNREVTDVNPNEILATFSGPRNAFHFLNEKNIRVSLKLYNAQSGIRTIAISKADFSYPKELNLEYIDPTRVKIRIDDKENSISNEPSNTSTR